MRGKNAVWLMEFVVDVSENNIRYFFPIVKLPEYSLHMDSISIAIFSLLKFKTFRIKRYNTGALKIIDFCEQFEMAKLHSVLFFLILNLI